MRLKILLLVLSFSALSAALSAKPVIDSVGVENQNGKKVILHKVAPKETYYAIARRYNVKPQAVISFNTNAVLHEGDIVKVPTELPFALQAAAAPAQTQTNTAAAGTIIQYKVAQHEYLYGLARRFNTTVEDIKKLNNLQNTPRTPGQVITSRQGAGAQAQASVPVQTQPVAPPPAPVAAPEVQAPVQTTTPANTGETGTIVQYKVTKHEYLYSVAKRFNSTVEDIKQRNNLKSNSLTPGMTLNILQGAGAQTTVIATQPHEAIVVQEKPEKGGDTIPAKRDTTNVATIADSLNAEHHAPSKYGLFEKNEKGVATTLDDPTLDQNKKLILHRTAPIGTVIKITNPMTNRTTFAKVVGRFTDNESTKDVILVMTKSVAESLGALDKRFHVNISYGVPNE